MRIGDWSSDVCSSDLLRTEGFRRSLERHGLAFDPRNNLALIPPARSFSVSQSWHAADAYRVASDLLDRGRRPDAFVVGDDYYATGLSRALRERCIRNPELGRAQCMERVSPYV